MFIKYKVNEWLQFCWTSGPLDHIVWQMFVYTSQRVI